MTFCVTLRMVVVRDENDARKIMLYWPLRMKKHYGAVHLVTATFV